MSTAPITYRSSLDNFSPEDVKLIKTVICKNSTDDELKLFLRTCDRLELDPLSKQIYAIKRDGQLTFQTSIDGYRLIAERTGKYMPGKEATFIYDKEGMLVSATSYVKKYGPDNQWHEIASTAFYDEYVAKTKEGKAMNLWAKMPHVMLAKCAESAAIRRAFPHLNIYTKEEMEQSENGFIEIESEKSVQPVQIEIPVEKPKQLTFKLNPKQIELVLNLIGPDEDYKKKILLAYGVESFEQLECSSEHFIALVARLQIENDKRVMKEIDNKLTT